MKSNWLGCAWLTQRGWWGLKGKNVYWSLVEFLEFSWRFFHVPQSRVGQSCPNTEHHFQFYRLAPHPKDESLYFIHMFCWKFLFFQQLGKKPSLHSGFPCINFVLKIMIPKKGSKPKIFIKHTIFRWFQVPALTFRHLGPFLTFFLIFLDFYLMISWNST